MSQNSEVTTRIRGSPSPLTSEDEAVGNTCPASRRSYRRIKRRRLKHASIRERSDQCRIGSSSFGCASSSSVVGSSQGSAIRQIRPTPRRGSVALRWPPEPKGPRSIPSRWDGHTLVVHSTCYYNWWLFVLLHHWFPRPDQMADRRTHTHREILKQIEQQCFRAPI